jgi:hypothetical protein
MLDMKSKKTISIPRMHYTLSDPSYSGSFYNSLVVQITPARNWTFESITFDACRLIPIPRPALPFPSSPRVCEIAHLP